MSQSPEPATQVAFLPVSEPVEPLGVLYIVDGQLMIGEQVLPCSRCGQSSGPWLLSAYPTVATMTCQRCGTRGSHPAVTPRKVERYADGMTGMWSSLDEAEEGLGFRPPHSSEPA